MCFPSHNQTLQNPEKKQTILPTTQVNDKKERKKNAQKACPITSRGRKLRSPKQSEPIASQKKIEALKQAHNAREKRLTARNANIDQWR